jgi:DUF1680 family protein
MNPLLSRGDYARQEWQQVACCPPNIMRLLASLAQYFVTYDDSGLQVHLYNTATINTERIAKQPVIMSIQTDYPWQGQVKLAIQKTDGSAWQLRLRIPGWSPNVIATINGSPVETPRIEAGYLVLERAWQPGDLVELVLSMEPSLIEAHPRIDAIRDSVAIQRGPIVYCLESIDCADIDLMDVRIDETAPLNVVWRNDLVSEGLMVIQSFGYILEDGDWHDHLYRRLNRRESLLSRPVSLTALPYYAWGNRGANTMRVWIPRADSS